MKNKIGMIGSAITALAVLAFAVCMLIPFDFGSYFVCIILSIGYVIMTAAFTDECDKSRKTAGIIASVFAGAYAVIIMFVYFTQCTTVMNEQLNDQAERILNYSKMGLMFNLDLLGYAIMALSTFFIGLTINTKNKIDKALKILLLIHGVFFISCLIMPMTGIFINIGGKSSMGGTIALEFWCVYFLPISILSYLHFKKAE